MMTRRFVSGLMIGLFPAASALGAELNLSIRSPDCNGTSEVIAAPGEAVDFAVCGVLTDTLNEGLALFGFDLVFDGGPLDQETVMAPELLAPTFTVPGGITNPDGDKEEFPDFTCPPNCGFSGTLIDGRLAQVGGGQNTIRNFAGNAPFPIADDEDIIAVLGLGHTETTLATGSLTAPASATAGVGQSFTLSIPPDSVFANVIRQGETGDPFWATEQADAGTITNLTVIVEELCAGAVASIPVDCDAALPRTQNTTIRLEFAGPITAPVPGEIKILALQEGGGFDPTDLSGSFTFEVEGGNVLRIRETGQVLSNATWYGIVNDGSWASACEFMIPYVALRGDVDDNGVTDIFDINEIWNNRGAAPDDASIYDMDGNGAIDIFDVNDAWENRAVARPSKPTGHDCPLP